MEDGSKALRFERLAFIAFDLFMLKRPGAEVDYTPDQIADAQNWLDHASEERKAEVYHSCLQGLPGSTVEFTAEQVLSLLDSYAHIDRNALKANLKYFLQEVIPVAEQYGVKMAIHPDDPPYQVLGLPRIVCSEADAADLIAVVPSPSNGLCFCTGSYGARGDNDLVRMIKRFGDQIHFIHLRNTKRSQNGDFYEADHLAGDTDMYGVMKELVLLQQKDKYHCLCGRIMDIRC